MRVRCTQCGAALRVLENDFYLRCPYCEASVVVRTDGGMPSVVKPVKEREQVERLFPPGAVESVQLRYFPYTGTGDRLVPVFNQPFDELLEYIPPSGDRTIWDEGELPPEIVIPVDEVSSDSMGSIVFHPFFLVMLSGKGYSHGVLVDGVSGKLLTANPLDARVESSRSTVRAASTALAWGILPSALLYILLRSGGAGMFSSIFFSILAAAGAVVLAGLLRKGLRSGQ